MSGLCLKRNIGQQIIILDGEDQIHVTLNKIYGKNTSAQIAVAAPPHVVVHRREVFDRIGAVRSARK